MLMKRLFLIVLLLAPLTNLAAQEAITVIPGARVRVFSTLLFSDSSLRSAQSLDILLGAHNAVGPITHTSNRL